MALSTNAAVPSQAITFIASVLLIAALYFGRQIFVPLALAFVLSFLLAPAVDLLQKIKFGRVPAVLLVMTLSFALAGVVGWAVTVQSVEVMESLPNYKSNLDDKIKNLKSQKSGKLSRAAATVEALDRELSSIPAEMASGRDNSKSAHEARPIPVQVAAPPSNFVQNLRELLGPLAEPLETAAIVIIFALFVLINREDLRNRAIRLAGHGQLHVMTRALDDAGSRLSRYLLAQFMVNTGFGVVFGTALYFIGIPHAALWGILAVVLRFVPYIGTLVAVAIPMALSLAVFPGWRQAGYTFGSFFVLEMIVSNVIEPLAYGAHTGISPLAILVAAIFWATIWGPVGLILSTPLTVCLIVLGRHVPHLSFLEVLLGDEPVLPPQQCFYQRLLAMDQEEARGIAESQLKAGSLESVYSDIIFPSLQLAERDGMTEKLDDATRRYMLHSIAEFIEDFGEPESVPSKEDAGAKFIGATGSHVICLPVESGPDELIATMMAQLLRQSGFEVREPGLGSVESTVAVIGSTGSIVCVSSISAYGLSKVRSLCKKLTASVPNAQLVIGLWNYESGTARHRLGPGCGGFVADSLSSALAKVRQLADPTATEVDSGQAEKIEVAAV